ncbi:IS630 transposase-related protein [Pedobacter lithocola]|uniref:IS630 transposase-related protein n=1 Tax=Pedobacter lithocola TaxID=1908239 RepID=A0ABV8PEK2_9SPHI
MAKSSAISKNNQTKEAKTLGKAPSVDAFRKACESASCNAYEISKAFDVNRRTIYNWLKQPKLKQVYDDVRESLLDFTESQQMILIRGLMKKDDDGNFIGWIERPSTRMIIFLEKKLGKHRGYFESRKSRLPKFLQK